MGLFGSIFGGGRTTTTQTTTLDPQTQAYVNYMRQQAQNAAGGLQGQELYTGPVSMGTLQGNINAFQNPYQAQVLGGLNAQYAQDLAMADRSAQQQATAMGAFGGSRAAIQQGAMEAQAALGHQQQVANLLYGGYQNALNAGMGWTQYNQQLQAQQAMEPLVKAQASQGLLAGSLGPYGQTTTNVAQQSANPFGSLLGLGALGAGIGFLGPTKFFGGMFGQGG